MVSLRVLLWREDWIRSAETCDSSQFYSDSGFPGFICPKGVRGLGPVQDPGTSWAMLPGMKNILPLYPPCSSLQVQAVEVAPGDSVIHTVRSGVRPRR